MRRLIRRAMSKGALRKTATLWEWDIAGRCEAPITRELWSRPSSHAQALAARRRRREEYELQRHAREEWRSSDEDDEWQPPPYEPKGFPRMIRGGPGYESLLQLRMHVRCRKCGRCRKMRSADWYSRATTELEQAQRSWFGTLTFNDITQFKALAHARKRATARSLVWETLTPEVQFNLHAASAYTEYVQKFWKRVRKATGARLRYLVVAECGEEKGRLHFHVLVHEERGSAQLKKEPLHSQWFGQGLGFDDFKLVKPEEPWAVRYVTKYIAKGMDARVRASARYGRSQKHSENVNSKPPLREKVGEAPTHKQPKLFNETGGVELGQSKGGSEWDTR